MTLMTSRPMKIGARKASATTIPNAKIVEKKLVVDPYEGDSEWDSDNEPEINRIGNVPLWYYKDEDHIGYDIQGKRIEQVFKVNESEIDKLLRNADDPDAWRTIIDVKNQTSVKLTATDLEIIRRVREGKLGLKPIDEEDDRVEFEFTDGDQPLTERPLRKAAFLPSKHEEKKILRLVKLIRTGKIYRAVTPEKPTVFDLWEDALVSAGTAGRHYRLPPLPAPKLALPGHAASYNPPKEYLWNDEEKTAWESAHPDDRELDFVPASFKCLRHVPGYANNLRERFLRCLDLYLCPRASRKVFVERSEDLLPELPPLSTFKPFPERQRLLLRQGGRAVTGLSVSPVGGILAAGCEDGSVLGFSTSGAPYCLPLWYLKASSRVHHYAIKAIQWHPSLPILTFTRGKYLIICHMRIPNISFDECKGIVQDTWMGKFADQELNDIDQEKRLYVASTNLMQLGFEGIAPVKEEDFPSVIGGSKSWRSFQSDAYFGDLPSEFLETEDQEIATDLSEDESTGHAVLKSKDWTETCKFIELTKRNRWFINGFVVNLGGPVKNLSIHSRGFYLATASPTCSSVSHQCLLHSLKKKATLAPLKRHMRGDHVHSVSFHPTQPWLCVGLEKSTKIYSLQREADSTAKNDLGALQKKFKGADQMAAMAVHVSGEHVVRTGNDGKLQWFDIHFGSLPFKTMELSKSELTSANFHPTLPLLAIGCSEGHAQLLHVGIDDAALGEAKLTPLNRLGEEGSRMNCVGWFPRSAWLATGHEDGTLVVWT